MTINDRIYEEVKKLPEPVQAEALDLVRQLALKAELERDGESELAWSSLSLSLAMRGMENEDTPTYSTEDLIEVFS